MEVLAAEKTRRQRQAANAASVGGGGAAAAAMTAAAEQLPQTQGGKRAKRAAGPTSEGSRKLQKGARAQKRRANRA
jgi:hypothetical protein